MRNFLFLSIMFIMMAWTLSPGDGVPDKAGGADTALMSQADLDLQAGILKHGDCGVPDTPDQTFANLSNNMPGNYAANSFKPIVQAKIRYAPWLVHVVDEVLRT